MAYRHETLCNELSFIVDAVKTDVGTNPPEWFTTPAEAVPEYYLGDKEAWYVRRHIIFIHILIKLYDTDFKGVLTILCGPRCRNGPWPPWFLDCIQRCIYELCHSLCVSLYWVIFFWRVWSALVDLDIWTIISLKSWFRIGTFIQKQKIKWFLLLVLIIAKLALLAQCFLSLAFMHVTKAFIWSTGLKLNVDWIKCELNSVNCMMLSEALLWNQYHKPLLCSQLWKID